MRDFFKTFDSFNKMLETIEKDFNPWFVGFDNADDEKEDASDVFEVRISDDNGKKEYYFRHNDKEETFTNAEDCLECARKEVQDEATEDKLIEDDTFTEVEEILEPSSSHYDEETSSNPSTKDGKMPFFTSDIYIMFTDDRFPRIDEIAYSQMFTNDEGKLCLQLTIEPHNTSLYCDKFRPGNAYEDCPIYISYSSGCGKEQFGSSRPLALNFSVKDYAWINPIVDDRVLGPDRKDKNNVLVPFRFRTTLVIG